MGTGGPGWHMFRVMHRIILAAHMLFRHKSRRHKKESTWNYGQVSHLLCPQVYAVVLKNTCRPRATVRRRESPRARRTGRHGMGWDGINTAHSLCNGTRRAVVCLNLAVNRYWEHTETVPCENEKKASLLTTFGGSSAVTQEGRSMCFVISL